MQQTNTRWKKVCRQWRKNWEGFGCKTQEEEDEEKSQQDFQGFLGNNKVGGCF